MEKRKSAENRMRVWGCGVSEQGKRERKDEIFTVQENVPLIFTYNDLNQRFWCFVFF